MANDGEIKVLDKCIVESEVVAAQSFMQCPIPKRKRWRLIITQKLRKGESLNMYVC